MYQMYQIKGKENCWSWMIQKYQSFLEEINLCTNSFEEIKAILSNVEANLFSSWNSDFTKKNRKLKRLCLDLLEK